MFWVHLAARLVLLLFSMLSWAYGIASYSPFAFDMFIRPGLLPALSSFVAWHHLWYWAVFVPVAVSLTADIKSTREGQTPGAWPRWCARCSPVCAKTTARCSNGCSWPRRAIFPNRWARSW